MHAAVHECGGLASRLGEQVGEEKQNGDDE